MAQRPKHTTHDVEAVITEAESHGWTFTMDNHKFKGKCGCGKHSHTITQGKLPWRSGRNLRSQLMICWR